jgi:enoyl-CoA hydratase/carnithine racemase
VPDDAVLDVAMERAREIAQFGVGSLRAIKQLMMAPHRQEIDAALEREMKSMAERVGTPENLEALQRFFSKGGR